MNIRTNNGSAVVEGESQVNGGLVTSRSVASYVDRQNFKAIHFSSRNFLTKAELLLNLYKIMRKDVQIIMQHVSCIYVFSHFLYVAFNCSNAHLSPLLKKFQ